MKRIIIAAAMSLAASGLALAQGGGANQTGPTGTLGTTMGGSYGGSTRNTGAPIGGMPDANGRAGSNEIGNNSSASSGTAGTAGAGAATQQPGNSTNTTR